MSLSICPLSNLNIEFIYIHTQMDLQSSQIDLNIEECALNIIQKSLFRCFALIFSCEEAALEGQKEVCLSVCVSV